MEDTMAKRNPFSFLAAMNRPDSRKQPENFFDIQACRSLWCSVIERAYSDALGNIGSAGIGMGGVGVHCNTPHERKRISMNRRRIMAEARTFLLTDGGWFDEICVMTGISACFIRDKLRGDLAALDRAA